MERYLIAISLLIFTITSTVYSQNSRTVQLDYNESDFILREVNGLLYIQAPKYAAILKEDTLAPALPFVCVNVLIGQDEDYAGFTSINEGAAIRENVSMARNPVRFFSNGQTMSNPDTRIQHEGGYYPKTQIEYTGTHEIQGLKFLSFLICPFRYNSTNRKLYFDTRINLNIDFTSPHKQSSKNEEYGKTYNLNNSILDFFVNKQNFPTLYATKSKELSQLIYQKSNDYPYTYLIVTTNELKNEFQRLADWKTRKGIRAKLITVESIYAQDTVAQRSNPQKIKNAIKTFFSNVQQQNLDNYVLLGGGINQIPAQLCHLEYSNHPNVNTPTDIYYASLSNLEWDTNHNGKAAEIVDSVNITPDINVARLPSRNVEEAMNMVDRIIDYEKNIDASNWKDSLLLCGIEAFISEIINGRLVSDGEAQSMILYQTQISPYWNGGLYRFFDTCTDHPNGANYDVLKSNLQNELQKGFSFVNITTHGNISEWQMEDHANSYDEEYANSLNNQHYSIISAASCQTNRFDNNTACLGESFLRNPNSGVLACYGSSRDAIGARTCYTLGEDMTFSGAFFKTLFQNHSTCPIGFAVTESKRNLYGGIQEYNSTRWMYLTLNLLGDPEMPVFLNRPSTFSNVSIYYNGDFLTVTGQVPYSMLCLASKYDRGNSYYFHNYYNPESQNGDLSFRYISDEYTFCLTQNGYIPYFAILGDTVHLQNETLKGTNRVIANKNVLIGSSVTDRTDEGAVIIGNGSTVVSCHGSVTITNDFEVKPGASFEIKANPTFYYE